MLTTYRYGMEPSESRSLCLMVLLCTLLCAFLLTACSPYAVRDFGVPPVEIDAEDQFPGKQAQLPETTAPEESKDQDPLYYWSEYQNDELSNFQEEALEKNYTLQEAAARVLQARAQSQISGAAQFPTLDVNLGGSRSQTEVGSALIANFQPEGSFLQNQFFIQNGLSFEIDIWRRVASGLQAEEMRVLSREADQENTQLLISNSVFQEWLNWKESLQLERVLQEQIASSETFLQLTELRYSMSQGTGLDVFEQRQQLASLQTELPRVQLRLREAQHALSVLLAQRPGKLKTQKIDEAFPTLPPLPPLVRPVDLIMLRPDLRAAVTALQAGEFDIARAVADRYPRLSLGISYDFSTNDIDDLFPNETFSGLFTSLWPMFDGGLRSGTVKREKAEVEELLSAFSRRFLEALQEVEDSLAAEKYQAQLLVRLREQLVAADNTLTESKNRYVNGVVDYLRVLVALQNHNILERTLIAEEKQQLFIRNRLYLALGGKVFPEQTDKEDSHVQSRSLQ